MSKAVSLCVCLCVNQSGTNHNCYIIESCNLVCTFLLWAHYASATSAALAASKQTSGFQDIHPCLSFVGWHHSCASSWRMYARYRRWPPSPAVCWQSNVLGQEIMQPVRWPHYQANAVEQSAWTASTTRQFKRSFKTFSFWLVGLQRFVSEH